MYLCFTCKVFNRTYILLGFYASRLILFLWFLISMQQDFAGFVLQTATLAQLAHREVIMVHLIKINPKGEKTQK